MRWYLGAVGLLSVVAGCSGTQVQGVVREKGTGEPLPGAIVRIGDNSTRSDLGGFYTLDIDVDDDQPQRVYASRPGYEALSELMPFDEDVEMQTNDLQLMKKVSAPSAGPREECERDCSDGAQKAQEARKGQVDAAGADSAASLDAAAKKVDAAAEALDEAGATIEEAATEAAEPDAPAIQAPERD